MIKPGGRRIKSSAPRHFRPDGENSRGVNYDGVYLARGVIGEPEEEEEKESYFKEEEQEGRR